MSDENETLRYYNARAREFFDSTVDIDMAVFYAPFVDLLPCGGKILDAGCGSGRDAKAFLDMGFDVEAFDASSELAALASHYLGRPVATSTFRDLTALGEFDGVWASASLLHLDNAELNDAISRLRNALRPNGVLYASFKVGSGEFTESGRKFFLHDEASLQRTLSDLGGLSAVRMWRAEDLRPERSNRWLNLIARKI